MKGYVIIFFLFASAFIYSQDYSVTFKLYAPALSPDSAVYITGSGNALGNWDPGIIKMEPGDSGTWVTTIHLDEPQSLEFKFTLGSWEREGADLSGYPLSNFNSYVSKDTIIEKTVVYWTHKGARKISGQITGTVEYIRNIKGEGIKERDVIIWLPPDYEKTSERYPVLYMHDGENIIDPETSSFGTDWSIDETADSLIRGGEVPPFIVVGIYNSTERSAEYLPGRKSDAYMDFIIKVLKPIIDSEYRTLPGRENTITGGSSAGGTISFMMVWEHPDVFSKAICMSSAFKLSDIDYIKRVKNTPRRDSVFFYIDLGGIGIDTRLEPGNDEMISVLKEKGYIKDKDFVYMKYPSADHSETAWARRFPEAIKLCLRKK